VLAAEADAPLIVSKPRPKNSFRICQLDAELSRAQLRAFYFFAHSPHPKRVPRFDLPRKRGRKVILKFCYKLLAINNFIISFVPA